MIISTGVIIRTHLSPPTVRTDKTTIVTRIAPVEAVAAAREMLKLVSDPGYQPDELWLTVEAQS